MPAKVKMVKGPASVVVEGSCRVLGSDVSNVTITIRAGKALPFEPRGRCRLGVKLRRGGRVWRADPRDAGTSMWKDLAQQIYLFTSGKKITVLIVGESDTGKSTLSTYLANAALGRGLAPCVIDGDIGQGDLAPPASVGAAFLSTQVTDLRDLNASMFEFVGSVSPVGFESLVARKLKSMLKQARPRGDICIVNTDGYARDNGIKYKQMLAHDLEPDVVVCLGKNPDLFDALGSGNWQLLHADSSGQAWKTGYERKSGRLDQFVRHIGRKSFTTNLSRVKFTFAGRLYSKCDLEQPPIAQLERKNLERMFVGLGSSGTVTGFGIITDVSNDSLSLQTDKSSCDCIYLSTIRLDMERIVEVRTC